MKPNDYYSSLGTLRPTAPSSPGKNTISKSVNSATSSAKKMKDRALSSLVTTTKLLSLQSCTPPAMRRHDDMLDILDEDEIVPVIYYPDEDIIAKRRVANKPSAYVDPFDTRSCDKKKTNDTTRSPTSVIPVRLFNEDSGTKKDTTVSADTPTDKKQQMNSAPDSFFEQVVTFDCPVFSINEKDDDTSSIQLSEAIKSINIKDDIKSVKETLFEVKGARSVSSKSLESSGGTWRDTVVSWEGFTKSAGWRKSKWDPNHTTDGKA